MPISRCFSASWLVALAVLACAAPRTRGSPRVFAQYSDSIDEHCKYHPETCVGAFGPEVGVGGSAAATTAAAPAGADAVVAIGTGILGASLIATTRLNQGEQQRIEEVLAQCADQAYSQVLKERFGGKNPSAEQCNQQVGVAPGGEPVLLKMKLGEEMHRAAYQCLKDRLRGLIGDRFSIEQRYRYNQRNGKTTVVSKDDEEWLKRHGNWDELRDSIVPDVVIHRGDPRYVQAVYDFKFPCADRRERSPWRRYRNGHPAVDAPTTTQQEVYEAILKQAARRVFPGEVIP
jgi:hypothetical protein